MDGLSITEIESGEKLLGFLRPVIALSDSFIDQSDRDIRNGHRPESQARRHRRRRLDGKAGIVA